MHEYKMSWFIYASNYIETIGLLSNPLFPTSVWSAVQLIS